MGADLGGAGGSSISQAFTASLTITFGVTELAGVAWLVNVDVLRAGALTIVNDGSGTALVTLDALTVPHAGGGSLVGSLDLAALSLGNAADPTSSPDLGFAQRSSAGVSGVGSGAAQSVTVDNSVGKTAKGSGICG